MGFYKNSTSKSLSLATTCTVQYVYGCLHTYYEIISVQYMYWPAIQPWLLGSLEASGKYGNYILSEFGGKIWSASEGNMVRFQCSASKFSGFLLLGPLVLTGILLFSDEV
jgi:hypothetical protein